MSNSIKSLVLSELIVVFGYYGRYVYDVIIEDVICDIVSSSIYDETKNEDYISMGDITLAIGRAVCNKMQIEV